VGLPLATELGRRLRGEATAASPFKMGSAWPQPAVLFGNWHPQGALGVPTAFGSPSNQGSTMSQPPVDISATGSTSLSGGGRAQPWSEQPRVQVDEGRGEGGAALCP
jgi:hypothetical protein